MFIRKKLNRNLINLFALLLAATLSGCGDSSDRAPVGNIPDDFKVIGVVASASSAWGSSGVDLYDADNNYEAIGPYHTESADIDVVGEEGFFYYIERYGTDKISRVDINNHAKKTWTFSTNRAGDDESSSNPYTLVTVSDTKGYLLRYDSKNLWVVDPSAQNEQDFFKRNIDLSAYSLDGKSVPHMGAAILHDEKLYVAIQRLEAPLLVPKKTGLIVEINTKSDSRNIRSIELQGFNPLALQYLDDVGLVIGHAGTYTYEPEVLADGGIEVLDLNTYTSKMVVAQTNETGNITTIAIKDKNTGYFTGYRYNTYPQPAATEIFTFDPTPDGLTPEQNIETLSALGTSDFRDVAISPNGNLWIADANTENPGIHILDPMDNSLIKFAQSPSDLLPDSITFVTEKK